MSRYVLSQGAVAAVAAMAAAGGFAFAMALASTPNGLPDGWVRPIVSANADAQVTEDSPGWDCSTMGNGLCGQPAGSWDLTSPYDRCLAAMEAAEIPGDMWDCYEYPRERP